MSCTLKDANFDVSILFDSLWDSIIKAWLGSSSRNNVNAEDTVEVFKREMGQIVNMVPYRDFLKLRNDPKDPAKAIKMRHKGNDMFHPHVKRYIEAIKFYNESITYATRGSEERALAYANRSIICLELQRYEDCLANIRLARASNYPERLAAKLEKRELDAKQALAAKNSNNDAAKHMKRERKRLELSYPAHKNMPQVANCLELQKNEKFGRHVVTNRPLKVGDVVMIDKPFVTLLLDKYRYVRCAYCYHETLFTLIPCEGCTVAMYCSDECLSKAHQQYHRYECGIIRELWKISGDIPVIALRSVAVAIATFDHDLLALEKHLADLDESSVNLFAMDWKSATTKDTFSAVHVLSTNQQLQRRREQAYLVFFAALLHKLVLERTELGSICGTNLTKKRLLLDLFVRYMQIMQCNNQWLTFLDHVPENMISDNEGYAKGCFPLISMLNHSCASNVKRITLRDGRCAVLVTRPIAAGSQLFDNYEIHHLKHERDERQNALQKKYHFRCDCEACLFDYPEVEDLLEDTVPTTRLLYYHDVLKHLGSHDPEKAKQFMATYQVRLTEMADNYPDIETCSCQVELERCFQIIYGYVSKLNLRCQQ